jgi:hypothetical protein
MPLYHTSLFSNDPPGAAFASRGAAWSFEKESGVYRGPRAKLHQHSATGNYMGDEQPIFFDMEIMIRARGDAPARRAMNLLVSAMAVLEG